VTGIELTAREGSRDSDGRDDEIALAARSNPAAFELLYRRHQAAVFRYLRARTGTDDDAAELAAVVFERALGAIQRYRPSGGGLLAWLFTIARNVANDAARSSRRRSGVRSRFTAGSLDPPDPRLPDDGLLERERLMELRRRVGELPDIQREAIVLRFAGGLTAREIGVTLGKSEAAAQKILGRALAALREAYRDDD
jgi:RNA polymerase sigma-70 factor (ECF subfamily)